MSSDSSDLDIEEHEFEIEEEDDIKISYIKTEKHNNKAKVVKDALFNEYQQFID